MATIFRPPIIVTITPPRKAKESWEVNVRLLLAPYPAQPFVQAIWPNPTRISLSLKSDYSINRQPLLAIQPSPFFQREWPYPALPPRKKDVLTIRISTAVAGPVAAPFFQSDWQFVGKRAPSPKIDNVVNLLPIQTVVVATPFSQAHWPNPYLRKDVSQFDYSFPIYVSGVPFVQSDWTTAFRLPRPKVDDVVNLLTIRTIVAGAAPFFQSDWLRAPIRLKSKVDDVVNLLTIRPPGVVATPFSQTMWPNATLPAKDVSQSDYSFPIYPVSQPFSQSDWTRILGVTRAKVDDVVNRLPIQGAPAAVLPFSQTDWPRLPPAKQKSLAEPFGTLSSLLTPNPSQPFNQTDWTQNAAAKRKSQQADAVELLLPIYSPPVRPFVNLSGAETCVTRRQTVKSDILINWLPLTLTPPPVFPFVQSDWPRPVLNVNRWQASAPQPSQKMPVPFVPPPPPPTTRRPLYLISGPSYWPGKT